MEIEIRKSRDGNKIRYVKIIIGDKYFKISEDQVCKGRMIINKHDDSDESNNAISVFTRVSNEIDIY